ncbi:hypothetical protein [Novipirellula sp.]|uniref:hypothetical protein n=1 Tax=Novipirellula sp. TaxID=2795430 RepID=UPI0035621698
MAIAVRNSEVTIETNHGLVFKVVVPTNDLDRQVKEGATTPRQQQQENPPVTPPVHE